MASPALSTDKVVQDLRLVVADTEELLKATASQTGERISAAREKAEESLKHAREMLDDAQAAMIQRAKHAAKATDTFVHENPWQSIGAAAVAGVLIGALIARR